MRTGQALIIPGPAWPDWTTGIWLCPTDSKTVALDIQIQWRRLGHPARPALTAGWALKCDFRPEIQALRLNLATSSRVRRHSAVTLQHGKSFASFSKTVQYWADSCRFLDRSSRCRGLPWSGIVVLTRSLHNRILEI